MNKVFGIGLSRTATTSLHQAFILLGYNSKHYPKNLEDIARHDAVTDATVACRFVELDKLYPGSKFILTVRDKESWLRSIKWLFEECAVLSRMDQKYRRLVSETRKCLYGTDLYEIDKLGAAFDRHNQKVISYFDGRNDLLVMNICTGDGFEKLCPFLGKPVPLVKFPNLNKS